jgi:hypothetical protein
MRIFTIIFLLLISNYAYSDTLSDGTNDCGSGYTLVTRGDGSRSCFPKEQACSIYPSDPYCQPEGFTCPDGSIAPDFTQCPNPQEVPRCSDGSVPPNNDTSLCPNSGTGCSQPLNGAGLCDDGCPTGTTRAQVSDGSTMCVPYNTTPDSNTAGSGTNTTGTGSGTDSNTGTGSGTDSNTTNGGTNTTGTGTNNTGTNTNNTGTGTGTNNTAGTTNNNTAGAVSFLGSGIKSVTDTVKNGAEFIGSKVDYSIGYGSGFFGQAMKLFKTIFIDSIEFILDSFKKLIQSLYDLIGISTALNSFNSLMSSPVGFFLELFSVPELLMATITAYLIRFAIRRIPIIG